MSTTTLPRLKARYQSEIRDSLKASLELPNVMQVPRLEKIVVNMGVGRATQQPSLLEGAVADMTRITGQKPKVTKSRDSIANFKLYDVALTAEEVAQEYALGRTGKSLNLTDTALCLGGTVPRAQLDVRGSALFGGNVGIGTTNPGALLELSGASQIDNSTPTKLRITSTTIGTTGTPIDTSKPYGLITF